jgi:cold-inducible RNA-binding protein
MPVRLFVGNLSYDVTESDLREFFSPVGSLSSVIIPMDRETGKPRGFAFVEFSEQEQADEASHQLNNKPLKGRNVTINEARAREFRPLPGLRPNSGFSRQGSMPARPPGSADMEINPMESARPGRSERRSRQFGADTKPGRKKKQRYGSKGEVGGRKGPIRERSGGQFFGDIDDEEDGYDEYDSDFKYRW